MAVCPRGTLSRISLDMMPAAVGCLCHVDHTTIWRRSWASTTNTNSTRNVNVGTTNEVVRAELADVIRHQRLRQVWDGGGRRRTM